MGEDPGESFSEACGLAGPLKVRLENPAREVASELEFRFRCPFLVVGRGDSMDLTIDSPAVSRRHAYFQVVAGRVFCVDLWSRTGVHWADGERTVGWVDRGQGVDIGPERIYFDGERAGSEGDGAGSAGQGGNLPISRAFEWSTLTDARLEFLGAEVDREPWQVSRSLALLGRSPICRVRLEGSEIANIHAALVRTPAGIWVVDLLGRADRLRVRGATMRFARLEDGDEIGLGPHQIRVRVGQAARPSGHSELARRPQGEGGRPARLDVGPLRGVGPKIGAGGRGIEDLKGSLDPVTERLFEQFDRMHQETTEQFRQAILMMFRMHQDQMGLIRDELSRLDRLEEEQKLLQAEMARINHPRPAQTTLRLVSGEPASPPHPSQAPRPVQAHPETDQPSGGRPSADRQPGGAPPPPSDPDPHARLSQRLAEIQDERQGLWKRLLGSLTGGESERILP
jgi:hypothetical protein